MCADSNNTFATHFSAENFEKVFIEKVQFQSATGRDGITARRFGDIASGEIAIALRKIWSSKYSVTRYREKLILKGRDKLPRVIAIPTVRDKLVLRVLNEYLANVCEGCHPPPINRTIAQLKRTLAEGKYTGYLRLDLQNFYDTIPHEPLLARLTALSVAPEAITLIRNAIEQQTYKLTGKGPTIGVPQGLPISNAVANIYLGEVDSYWKADPAVSYTRFVDDILILGEFETLNAVHVKITEMFTALGLSAHELGATGKSTLKKITEPVAYLGYRLAPGQTSIREATVHKLKESLIGIFVSHLRQKRRGYLKKLIWRLNLRITGCIVNDQRFGWLFFFSEIDDLSLLKSLDIFVQRLLKRWKVKRVKTRRFVRTLFEIRFRAASTSYIPSFDGYELAEKVRLLKDIFGVKITADWTEKDISREFYIRIRRETISLEEDLVRIS